METLVGSAKEVEERDMWVASRSRRFDGVKMLNGVPSAKCLIKIITFPQSVNMYTDGDWAGQPMTGKGTSGGVVQWRNATLSAWSRTHQSVSLTTGIVEGMVTKHHLKELGYEVTVVHHVDSQSAQACASKRGLGRMKHVMLKCMFVQDVLEKKQTTLASVDTKSIEADLMVKCHTFENAHERMHIAGSETQQRRRKTRLKPCEVM